MLNGHSVAEALAGCDITHVVWIPDSTIGAWESALSSHTAFQLIRVCREGEAFAVAAGLLLGGKRPIILIQCTGLFEAGDALRNVVHDLKLPVFALIGLRNYGLYLEGKTTDTCPVFAETILTGWNIPYRILDASATADDLKDAYLQARKERRAGAVFLAE